MTIDDTTRIEIDTKQIGSYFTKVRSNVLVALQKEMTAQSRAMHTFVTMQYLRGGTTASRLRMRSGNLIKTTIPMKTKIVGSMLEGGIQFGAEYAPVHVGEEGHITRIPKGGAKGMLAIPIGAMVNKSGVSRMVGGGIRQQYPFLTLIKSKKGNLILADVRKKGKIIPYFVLKSRVMVKTRVFPKTIIQRFAPEVKRGFEEAIKTAIK